MAASTRAVYRRSVAVTAAAHRGRLAVERDAVAAVAAPPQQRSRLRLRGRCLASYVASVAAHTLAAPVPALVFRHGCAFSRSRRHAH